MQTLVIHTIMLFLMLYACLDILYHFADFLLRRLSHPAQHPGRTIVFAHDNADELEWLVRSACKSAGEVYVVDLGMTAEGRRIMQQLCVDLPYVHIVDREECPALLSGLSQSTPASHAH